MEKNYSVIILSAAGDFLVEEEDQLEKKEKGVVARKPYIYTEEDEAQRIDAEKIFVPYSSMDNIQYGEFDIETVELE
ncbi:MAG: hypothetical protein H8Z69_05230 [Nanohaloarchaea archaeon]|nr:hypothetical protein [Candidatus Nanohaloarchaea archaeon]